MAIAEMPSHSGKRDGVLAANLGERLGRRDDFDDASVIEREPVARAQHHRLRQIEEKSQAAHARHRHAAAIAVVVVEDDGIGRRAGPRAGGANGAGDDHKCRGPSW